MLIKSTPKNNWYNDIEFALYFLTNTPFNTAKRDPKKEEINAYIIPNLYCVSKLKITYKPAITSSPNTISIDFILLLKNKGSIKEVKNAPVLIVTKAIETLDTFIALKKNTQCNAIIIPVHKNFKTPFLSTLNDFFFIRKYITIKSTASPILKNTRGIASKVISAPRIAVKPQIKTMRCKSR
jgi:hypothetical protein